jgi:LysM domain
MSENAHKYLAAYIVVKDDNLYDLSVSFTNADIIFDKTVSPEKAIITGTKGKQANYTFQPGDTEQNVTKEFTWTKQQDLFEAMQEVDPTDLVPGEKIWIPGHDYSGNK